MDNRMQVIEYGTGYYEGETKDNKPNGKGQFFSNEGNRYEGEWKDGLEHGLGRLFLSNGNRYEGNWKEGWINGKGRQFDSKGQLIQEGMLKKGVIFQNF